jgi:diphosphomevalonate decarboxylase
VTSEARKSVASTAGMLTTSERSPYYAAWLNEAPKIAMRLREAVLARDFEALGELTEASAFAMHASALAAGVLYLRGATVETLAAVRELRRQGLAAYATMDAGPHVKVLVRADDVPRATAHLVAVPGVLRVIDARPGNGAELVDAASAKSP